MQFNFIAIVGRETASNKQTASKSCALSIVRQLYHLGVIEAFSGTLKKNKETDQMKPYPVKINPELEQEINNVLEGLQINPVHVNTTSVGFETHYKKNNNNLQKSITSTLILDTFFSKE